MINNNFLGEGFCFCFYGDEINTICFFRKINLGCCIRVFWLENIFSNDIENVHSFDFQIITLDRENPAGWIWENSDIWMLIIPFNSCIEYNIAGRSIWTTILIYNDSITAINYCGKTLIGLSYNWQMTIVAVNRVGQNDSVPFDFVSVDMPEVRISATELRDRFTNGLDTQYLVPKNVSQYISDQGLYQAWIEFHHS